MFETTIGRHKVFAYSRQPYVVAYVRYVRQAAAY